MILRGDFPVFLYTLFKRLTAAPPKKKLGLPRFAPPHGRRPNRLGGARVWNWNLGLHRFDGLCPGGRLSTGLCRGPLCCVLKRVSPSFKIMVRGVARIWFGDELSVGVVRF